MKVFKPGVFDLFHIGHLNSIQQAASCGDYLVVGVQDDRDVEICKGRKPVIPLQERMAIIAGLKGVDEVISYRNANLSKLLAAFDIDVLAVGEDYGCIPEFPDQQATLKYCAKHNITVHRTPRLENVSTSDIRQGASYRAIADKRKAVQSFWDNISSINKQSSQSTMLTSFGGDPKLIDEQTRRELELFKKFIKPTDRVLDLGCGNGRITIGLAPFCHRIVGVDFSENLIRAMNEQNHLNIQGICDDVCSGKSYGEFDVIVLSGLFPCLDNDQYDSVLATCMANITDCGHVLVRTSMADTERINVINQFSEGLGALYTAYYRTMSEIIESMREIGLLETYYQFLYRNHPDTHIGFLSFERKKI